MKNGERRLDKLLLHHGSAVTCFNIAIEGFGF